MAIWASCNFGCK